MVNLDAEREIRKIINGKLEKNSFLPTPGIAFSHFALESVMFDILESTRFPIRNSFTDGSRDGGLDGILITINHIPVTSVKDIPLFIPGIKYKIRFFFIQSKYKDNFNSNDWKAFSSSIISFFSNQIDRDILNPKVRNFLKILDALKKQKDSYNMKFVARVVIVSMPEKLINPEITNGQQVLENVLITLGFVDSVKYKYYGASQLLALYQTRKHLISQNKTECKYSSRGGYRIVA